MAIPIKHAKECTSKDDPDAIEQGRWDTENCHPCAKLRIRDLDANNASMVESAKKLQALRMAAMELAKEGALDGTKLKEEVDKQVPVVSK